WNRPTNTTPWERLWLGSSHGNSSWTTTVRRATWVPHRNLTSPPRTPAKALRSDAITSVPGLTPGGALSKTSARRAALTTLSARSGRMPRALAGHDCEDARAIWCPAGDAGVRAAPARASVSTLAAAPARHTVSMALMMGLRFFILSSPFARTALGAPGAGGLGQAFDDLDELFTPVAVLASQPQQIPGLGQQGAALRGAGHGDAAAAAELQQSLVAQQPQRAQHGVAVHPEHGRQVAGGGQPLTGRGLPLGDGAADLGGYLLVQRGRITVINPGQDRASGTTHNGFILAP